MIARSAKLIFITDFTILVSTMISSLVGARALGPAGRGDLLVVVLWPPVIAMLAGLGLPTAYRYWMAKEPERVSPLFSNAVVYTVKEVCDAENVPRVLALGIAQPGGQAGQVLAVEEADDFFGGDGPRFRVVGACEIQNEHRANQTHRAGSVSDGPGGCGC